MKIALVSGATGNLGQAVIRRLLDDAYQVYGTIVPNTPASSVIEHPNYRNLEADLTDEAVSQGVVDKVIAENSRVDIAVLTVGGFTQGKIADTKTSDIRKQVLLNFETAYNLARPLFIQMMKQGYGRIFLVGSRPGSDMHQSKGMVAYGLSKSLIFRLAEIMNDEAKGKNIVTSVIVPSTIDTDQNRSSMPEADFSKWVKAEDIASIISYYSSEAAAVLREPVIRTYNNA